VTSGDRFPIWRVNGRITISTPALEVAGTAIASWIWRGPVGASSWGSILNSFLIAILLGAIVLLLGRLHSYYLDENERIAKGLRTLDDW
jgi:hypothetical protein